MPEEIPPAERKLGVLIVEDQTAIRHLLAAFIGAMPGYAMVGEAGNVADALAITKERQPHVVVLDWMLLGGVGVDFLRRLGAGPRPRVLVFSANTTDLAVREALSAGALGYIEKTASFAEFTEALHAVAAGKAFFGPAIARAVQRIVSNPERFERRTDVSPRERDVLRFLAEGLSSKEIADRLGLSVRTVENHRASITRRTGLRSVAQLTLHAVRLGLVAAPAAEAQSESAAPALDGGLGDANGARVG